MLIPEKNASRYLVSYPSKLCSKAKIGKIRMSLFSAKAMLCH